MDTQGFSSKRNADDESGSNDSKKPKMELPKEEDHFSKFFDEALEIIKKTMQVSDDELQNGIETVIESFYYEKGNRFSDIDLKKAENLCGYFYRFSQLNTELSRNRILDAVDGSEVLQSDLKRSTINVVSIGGGPGFDIVGMLSAFYEKVNCKKLNITVVDKAERWKSLLLIVEFLLREGDFGNACSMFKKSNTSLSFIHTDASEADRQTVVYSKEVNEADIIIMQRLLSSLSLQEIPKVAEDVVQKMKNGALLMNIESPSQMYYFEDLGLEKIYPQDLEENNYDNDDYFEIQGSSQHDYGYRADHSNAQIVVYKKKHD